MSWSGSSSSARPTATVTADVTLNASAVGPYSGSVTYRSSGTRVNGTGPWVDTDTIPVTANLISCAVPDTTAPTPTVPADVTAEATSAAGAVVSYSASANNDVDGPVPVSCLPSSGSTFGLGTTTVNCRHRTPQGTWRPAVSP